MERVYSFNPRDRTRPTFLNERSQINSSWNYSQLFTDNYIKSTQMAQTSATVADPA